MKKTSIVFYFSCLGLFLLLSQFSFAQSKNYQDRRPGFIENKGQIKDQNNKPNKSIKFLLSLSNGMNLQLMTNSFSYDTYVSENAVEPTLQSGPEKFVKGKAKKVVKLKFHRVDIQFIHANPSPRIIAEEPSSFYYNYVNMSSVSVHSYGKIIYKNLYPHIDLIFEKRDIDSGGVSAEYFFVVNQGGDPSIIRWKYSGAYNTCLHQGGIEITVSKGKLQEHIPKSFLTDHLQKKVSSNVVVQNIAVHYKQIGKDEYAFSIPAYDHAKILTIDPIPALLWGTYYGDYLNDWSYAIAKDQPGNLFICGSSDNALNIATSGAYQTTLLGYSDAIIGKFDKTGKLLWMTYFGGSSFDEAAGIATDNTGNIVITGNTFSTDFPTTAGAYQSQLAGGLTSTPDAFIAKFDTNGNLVWSTYYGGTELEYGTGIAIDQNNKIFICGFTQSTSGIATGNAYQPAYGGGTLGDAGDGFIASFTGDGAIIWSTFYGGSASDACNGIALDNNGSVFVTGSTASLNNMSSPGAFQATPGGNGDAFIAKFSNAGMRIWGTFYGGAKQDFALAITTDNLGNVIAGGETQSHNNIATVGSGQPVFAGGVRDAFLVKFDNNGNRIWGSYFGGEGDEDINAITTDANENIFVTGSTYSTTGISTANSYQKMGGGGGGLWSTFIEMFKNSSGRVWGTYYGYGGPYGEGYGYGIQTDANDNVYVTGGTSFTTNISSCGAQQVDWSANYDIFLAKFGQGSLSSLPSIVISTDDSGTICQGATVSFTAVAQNLQNNHTFQWLLNGNPVGADTSVFSTSGLKEDDSVRCLLELNSQCVTGNYSSNSIIIHVDPGLVPSITISSLTDTICQGDALTFTASGINGGNDSSFQWLQNGIAIGVDSSAFTTKSLSTADNITCTFTRHHACTIDSVAISNSVAVYVRQLPQPSISITASADTICSGLPVYFKATVSGAPNPTYQWKINSSNAGSDSSGFTSINPDSGDQITCLLTATGSVCATSAVGSNTITEIIYPTPVIVITGDTIITKGSSTQLFTAVSGNAASYQWTPSTTLNNSIIANPVASPDTTTAYTLTVNSQDGCIAQKQVTVIVIAKISIPNAFTPNGDGKNEGFRALYGSDISDVHFQVFNRWGQPVFEDNGSHKIWDGKLSGVLQPAGTYVWVFEYKDARGVSTVLKGAVQLIR